jgi:hypothetical protein
VAAKDAVHYDPRRVRASVTGQTTVAASSATTSRPKGRIVTAFFAAGATDDTVLTSDIFSA